MIRATDDPEEYIKTFMANDRLGSLLGGKFVAISASECLYEYQVSEEHFNPNGILHGGALFSIMDSSQGAFVHYFLDAAYKYAATGTATIRFHAPVEAGILSIRTWLKHTERRKLTVCSLAVDSAAREIASLEEIWIAILAS